MFFHDLEEKLEYLVDNDYYEESVVNMYEFEKVKQLFKLAYSYKYRFKSYVGALKFYTSYALKTNDGEKYLERFEDRVVMVAIVLSDGDYEQAVKLVRAMMTNALQPATPTFMNAGRKNRGEYVSCFLLNVSDNLESIMASITQAAQLSKKGGGVGIGLTDIRASGDPIKGVEGASSGVLPFAKVLEDTFSWIDQLATRQGACVVYLHAHHLDVLTLLDAKRENADEKIRLKSLSVGLVIPDITYELAQRGEDMYLFSPYDVAREYGVPFSEVDVTKEYRSLVENPNIRKKKVNAREFFQTVAELRYESGYPYLLNVDTANMKSNVAGTIKMSNLCSEILQPQTDSTFNEDGTFAEVGKDISCNLASMNITNAMTYGPKLGQLVETAVRGLTTVTDMTDIKPAPTVARGNRESHSIGLGQMDLASFLATNEIIYGDEDALEFVLAYFSTIAYHAYRASMLIARERDTVFVGFEDSKYATGEAFEKYLDTDYRPTREKVITLFEKAGVYVPGPEDWEVLTEDVYEYGLYHSHLLTIPPNGSISYLTNSSSSLEPVKDWIEIRKEGKLGRVYYPAPGLTNENKEYFAKGSAYVVGTQAVIDTYVAAGEHIDQGLSMNLFYNTNSTKEAVSSIFAAWKAGLKTMYYARVKRDDLAGTEFEDCVSCAL